MRYIDTGSRDPKQTLAKWLEDEVAEDIDHLRMQTGFFSFDAVGLLVPVLKSLAQLDQGTTILLGSNDGLTLGPHVTRLAQLIGVPRQFAELGVVSFSAGYFHPKVIHFTRGDGTEAAYVGSANLTGLGLTTHVEAGVTLDSRLGDDEEQLGEIASAIDAWFADKREGFTRIDGIEHIAKLVELGILSAAPPPPKTKQTSTASGETGKFSKPKLKPLVGLPAVGHGLGQGADEADAQAIEPDTSGLGVPVVSAPPTTAPVPTTALLASAPKKGIPDYFLFDPAAKGPTKGAAALTGATLPGGAVGLIVALSKDSARYFEGKVGTGNLAVPVPTVPTVRFGVFGTYGRPRAEFDMRFRYVNDQGTVMKGHADTNIMGYGVAPGESGHRDVRMVVPGAIRSLATFLKGKGLTSPKPEDVALLEWPTVSDPVFRLTFIDPKSKLFNAASAQYAAAQKNNALVGKGACWLPATLSPKW